MPRLLSLIPSLEPRYPAAPQLINQSRWAIRSSFGVEGPCCAITKAFAGPDGHSAPYRQLRRNTKSSLLLLLDFILIWLSISATLFGSRYTFIEVSEATQC